ncbi:hypothetical protein A4H34_00340 [Peptidiphaga gingivicola]|uniref:ESX secretion-associated protein EspG n=1 Tax=Peptidiphaga gingivicola TaxID=2741497 RepID=A0A179B1Y0_9ACTO|nr:hypothetical protein [Peptidiphaga gingivicola]OAP85692.1 hypothetical protein A4H34_00340 [Peptidiphaga gingivicola]
MQASANVIVPQKAWDDLRSFLAGDGLHEGGMAELARLGFFEDGCLTDVARKLVAPYREPVGHVELLMNEGGIRRNAVAWIDENRESCVAQTLDDSVALSSYETAEFPVVMVDLLDVGPRPVAHPTATTRVPKEWVLGLLEPSEGGAGADSASGPSVKSPVGSVRDRLADEMSTFWPEVRESLREGDWKLWAVYSRPATETAGTRGPVCVLDTSKGYFRVVFDGDSAVIRPAASLQVWCALAYVIAPAA